MCKKIVATLMVCGILAGSYVGLRFVIRKIERWNDQYSHQRYDPTVALYSAMVQKDEIWVSANVGRNFNLADVNPSLDARVVGTQHVCALTGPGTVRIVADVASSEEIFFHFTAQNSGSAKNSVCADADFVSQQHMPTEAEVFSSCYDNSVEGGYHCYNATRNPFVDWLARSIDKTNALREERAKVDHLRETNHVL